MDIQKVLALRGPNIWASFPVLEAWVDLGPLKDSPSDELPGFNERLMTWLPTLVEHRCSIGTRGGFFERLRRGTYQAHILEHVGLELQTLAGTDVGYGRTRETSEEGVYKVALEYDNEELGRAALDAARSLCLAAVHDLPFDVDGELRKLRELYQRVRLRPGLAALFAAARKQQVPLRALNDEGLLQLGHGARQRRLWHAQTDRTGALAESIAGDWDLACDLLRAAGVPVADPANAPAGARWRLLVIGDRVAAAVQRDTGANATEAVHPEVAARVVEAARMIGLEVAGVDVIAADIGLPLEEQGGAVVSVDARPNLDLHSDPAPAATALIAHLYPEGQTGRIPLVAVTGVNGKTTTVRLLGHLIARTHRCVGMTCTEGIYVGNRRIESGDCSGPRSARTLLQHRQVEAAVLETARGGILREGLGFDRCDVAVVTNIGEGDHLGLADVDTPEQLARVKGTVVEAVTPEGAAVLRADDPLVAEMAPRCPGSVVWFARDGNHPIIVEHCANGGRAAYVRDGEIILAEGEQKIPLVALECVPLTHGGRIGFQVLNVLAAAAAAWSLGIPCEAIRVGLETFVPDLEKSPGRFNLLEVHGAVVILDYGHNASSLASLLETLDEFPQRRRWVIYSAAGDRRNEDLIHQGELLGDSFDRVILFEDHYTRGRKPGEIMALFRQGMALGGRVEEVQEIYGALQAMETALRQVRPGDLLLIQADEIDESVQFMKRYLASGVAGREIDFDEALALMPVEQNALV